MNWNKRIISKNDHTSDLKMFAKEFKEKDFLNIRHNASAHKSLKIGYPRDHFYCLIKQSHVLELLEIIKKFNAIPNTGLLDIWLQRISYKVDKSMKYAEPVTKLLDDSSCSNAIIWCCDWLKEDLKKIVFSTSVVDFKKLGEKEISIDKEEVALFKDNYVW